MSNIRATKSGFAAEAQAKVIILAFHLILQNNNLKKKDIVYNILRFWITKKAVTILSVCACAVSTIDRTNRTINHIR